MPVTKSATKALRRDNRRQQVNRKIRASLKKSLDSAKSDRNLKNISIAYSTLDKAAKKGVVHANRAARLKASLSRLIKPAKSSAKTRKTPGKKQS
jgi:small subunit ribosomal protein S20